MKILFLTNIPSPYRVEFFDFLAQKCELTVVYERRSASDREKEWYIDKETNYEVHFLKGISYSNDAAIAPGVLRFLCKGRYDIVITSGYSSFTQILTILALRCRRIPYILNVDGGVVRDESKGKYRFKKSLISGASYYLSTGRSCDRFLEHYGAKKELIRRYPFTSVRKADIIERSLSVSEKKEYKERIGCSFSKMILSVGQPIHRKGFDLLIKAAEDLGELDAGFFIVGGNPDEECSGLLKDLNVTNVSFVPFMKKEQLAEYYLAADCFVLPTREDVWGLVINEAMTYGLPVITTDKCGAGLELVEDGVNGYIVESENSKALGGAIRSVLDCDEPAGMADASLSKIEEYTLENMADVHISIFKEILGE